MLLLLILAIAGGTWLVKSCMEQQEDLRKRKLIWQNQESAIEKEIEQTAERTSGHGANIRQEQEAIEKEAATIRINIKYAEGIQRSLIPSPRKIKGIFPESFVYFEPKDVVSGDYYLMEELRNHIIMVVADCTGHGVPGGFLSMLGMAGLKQILPQYHNADTIPTGEILGKMRDFVISSLAEAIETEGDDSMGVNDGMDMTMVAFRRDMKSMTFSLADHNIYLSRDGEIEKLKGDRMPIGRHPNQDQPFATKTLNLMPGDMVYLCSDGIQDQIGGPDDCKFLTKRLAKLLQEHCQKPIETQRTEIAKVVDNWKRGYDQVDDQTLIGIRIQ